MSQPHNLKKHLGQNFLNDLRTQERIIQACDLCRDDVVLEIGPGQGAMTRLIAPAIRQLTCIETDKDLIPSLKEEFNEGNVRIIHADFLKWDMRDMPQKIKVIGNIPYYISTPILEKLIEHRRQIAQAYLTVQWEFGQRLAAKHGGKEYGSLSCFAQINAQVDILFKINKAAFKPAPKVDSCFVRLDFTKAPRLTINNEEALFKLIRTAFTQRRKNILNALSPMYPKEKVMGVLDQAGVKHNARPEELNIEKFVAISNGLV